MNSVRIQTNEHPHSATHELCDPSCVHRAASPDPCTHVQDMQACTDECDCTKKVLRIIERCLKFNCFRMEKSKNLLAALKKMLAMKTAGVEPSTSSNPTSSTSAQSSSLEPVPSAKKRPHEVDQSNTTKKPRLDKTMRQSVGNTFSTINIPVGTSRDLTVFLEQAKGDICGATEDELCARNALKFYLTVNLELERISTKGVEVTSEPYLQSLPSIILERTDLDEEYQIASDRLKDLLDVFQGEGSGFSLKSILKCTLNVATYDVVGRSLFIELFPYIKDKKATVNMENADVNVFYFA